MFEIEINSFDKIPTNGFANIHVCCQEMFNLLFWGFVEPRKKYKEHQLSYLRLKLQEEGRVALIKCPSCGQDVKVIDNRDVKDRPPNTIF